MIIVVIIFKDASHQLLLLLLYRIKIASSVLLKALYGSSFSAGRQVEIRCALTLNTWFPLSASLIAILIKYLN